MFLSIGKICYNVCENYLRQRRAWHRFHVISQFWHLLKLPRGCACLKGTYDYLGK
jgi:hypothetical protein